MLTGGSEAAVIPSGIGGFIACKVLTPAQHHWCPNLSEIVQRRKYTEHRPTVRSPFCWRTACSHWFRPPITVVCQALSRRNDAPESASRPWDKGRDGFVMGEGAGARHNTAQIRDRSPTRSAESPFRCCPQPPVCAGRTPC